MVSPYAFLSAKLTFKFPHALIWFAPVLLVPAKCDPISVCIEDDRDLRVDCLLNSKPHKINNYEFLWSSGTKQLLISSNVSGSSVVNQYKGKSEVRPLDPVGYRMTLKGFTEDLKQNTTFTCKVSGDPAQVTLGRGMRLDAWVESPGGTL